ncbi:type 1 fimbrial protein [Enterobacter bugandensis]|uniref:Type 1 fimbrial protein n=1 Tax=Enterobacter bugandensis TaxID=881260 RepID=A0AA42PX36_9ENTR|nr:fimbrial protein [Enterobacter bugandensis]MDH1321535.1 type 1 fimbrial protein [Enterobacter bugandensis]
MMTENRYMTVTFPCERRWMKRIMLLGRVGVWLTLLVLGTASAWAANDNLQFNGTLTTEPCTLDPDSMNINVDFGTVIDKYLYINMRTHSKPFDIRLLGCDTTLGKSVTVTFKGTPDSELPSLLALSSGSASGIAIGLEQADGTVLPINQPASASYFMAGNNVLSFRGYVQIKPSAMQNLNVARGNFNAMATFALDYP